MADSPASTSKQTTRHRAAGATWAGSFARTPDIEQLTFEGLTPVRRRGVPPPPGDAHGSGGATKAIPTAANSIGRLTREDVMTVGAVADLLHLKRSTVYDLARRGAIPGHRVGRAWRFVRQDIEAMLRTR